MADDRSEKKDRSADRKDDTASEPVWRRIPAYPDYEVGSGGRVRLYQGAPSPNVPMKPGEGAIQRPERAAGVPGYKKGGSVKETGIYKLHKGEEVLNSRAAKRYRRSNGRG